jgi:hypothetical protein
VTDMTRSLNIGAAHLVGAAITLAALYLAEQRCGVRRIIPGALASPAATGGSAVGESDG